MRSRCWVQTEQEDIFASSGLISVGFKGQLRVLRPIGLNAVPIISNHTEHSDALPDDLKTIRRSTDLDQRDPKVRTNA